MAFTPSSTLGASDLNQIVGATEGSLGATTVPGASYADLGISATVSNPGTSAIWEVSVDLDVRVTAATVSVLQVALVAGGSTQSGPIVAASNTSLNGFRFVQSHKWIVSGLAANAACVFKLQALQSVAAVWNVTGGAQSHIVVRRIG